MKKLFRHNEATGRRSLKITMWPSSLRVISLGRGIVAVLVVTLVGYFGLHLSHAATYSASTEAENGTLASGAATVSDTNASGGSAVKFGTAGSGGGVTRSTNCTPATSATMTNATSHLCGFPDTTNTGTSGTLFSAGSGPTANTGSGWTVSGGMITVATGGVLKNVDTGGDLVTISGANATVENCKILSNNESGFGISLSNATNALVENNEIGDSSTSGNLEGGIKDFEVGSTYSANTDIKANNIYRTSTAIQVDHGTIESNYIHDLVGVNGEHINGTTSNGGGDDTLMTVRNNTVFNPNSQTDAISLFEDFAVQQNRVIDDNLIAGGGYCLYAGQNAGGATVNNISVTNNHFSRMYYSQCGADGYLGAGNGNGTWTGNVWDDTGATLGN